MDPLGQVGGQKDTALSGEEAAPKRLKLTLVEAADVTAPTAPEAEGAEGEHEQATEGESHAQLADASQRPANEDMHKVQWSRAARTDKGVSAVGQCVSLNLVLGDGMVEAINRELPSTFKVRKKPLNMR